MLYDVSVKNPEIKRQIDLAVGPAFSLIERLRRRGIGVARLPVTNCSSQIREKLDRDSNRNICNLELRPRGIIIGFRSRLNSFALVIPFYTLTISKKTATEYSLYGEELFVEVKVGPKQKYIHRFMERIISEKANSAGGSSGG